MSTSTRWPRAVGIGERQAEGKDRDSFGKPAGVLRPTMTNWFSVFGDL
jgi:hypothetical protein